MEVGFVVMKFHGGDDHGECEEQAHGAVADTEDEQDSTDAFRRRGHEAPEYGKEVDSQVNHLFSQSRPELWAGGEFWEAVEAEHDAEADAQDEEAGVAVFSEKFEEHGAEGIGLERGREFKKCR